MMTYQSSFTNTGPVAYGLKPDMTTQAQLIEQIHSKGSLPCLGRCNGERQAESDGKREWTRVWRNRELDRQSAGARSAQERRVRSEAASARSEDSVRERDPDAGAFAVFRGREDLGRPDQSSQSLL